MEQGIISIILIIYWAANAVMAILVMRFWRDTSPAVLLALALQGAVVMPIMGIITKETVNEIKESLFSWWRWRKWRQRHSPSAAPTTHTTPPTTNLKYIEGKDLAGALKYLGSDRD